MSGEGQGKVAESTTSCLEEEIQLQKGGARVWQHSSFPGWGPSQENGVPGTCEAEKEASNTTMEDLCTTLQQDELGSAQVRKQRARTQASKTKTAGQRGAH